mgnify:CR=1 FL=1
MKKKVLLFLSILTLLLSLSNTVLAGKGIYVPPAPIRESIEDEF